MDRPAAQALLAKTEAATQDDEHELIAQALRMAWTCLWIEHDAYDRGHQLVGAGAYLEAALTLVPEGCGYRLDYSPSSGSQALVCGRHRCEHACTPALAICIAELKARLEEA